MTYPPPNLVGSPERRSRIVLGALGVLAVVAFLVWYSNLSGVSWQSRDLIDSDGYMRYLRVQSLLEDGGWWSPFSPRSNAPFGEILHWTRPLDVVVVVIRSVLAPFLGPNALYGAAVVNGPILLVASALALAWAVKPMFESTVLRLMLIPGVILAPVLVTYAVPGRVDHHALLAFVLSVVIGLLLRAVAQAGSSSVTISLGVALAFGLWVSAEFIIPLALVAGTFGAYYLFSRIDPIGPTITFASAALASAIFVWVERGPDFLTIEFDRLSPVHALLCLVTAGVFGGLVVVGRRFDVTRIAPRLAASLAFAGAGLLLLLVAFPEVAGGPFVGVDPVVAEGWLYRVVELHPLVESGRTFGDFVGILGGPALAAVGFVSLKLWRRGEAWILMASWTAAYVALSFVQVRWAMFAQLLALPFVLVALGSLRSIGGSRPVAMVARTVLLAIVVVALPFGSQVLSAAAASENPGSTCEKGDTFDVLDRQPPGVVLGEVSQGPEILYRTDHSVIATPYHRNTEGVRFFLDAFATSSVDELERLLTSRSVDFVVFCPFSEESNVAGSDGTSIIVRLGNGEEVPFLQPIPLSSGATYLLFEVTK